MQQPPADWPPPPPPWATGDEPGRRRRSLAVGLASFVLAGGAALGALTAFTLLRAPGDALGPMVPESSVIYVNAEIQPSGTQALTLSALAAKFPILSDSVSRARWVDSLIDDALSGSGLDAGDVLPWLGPQVGLSVDPEVLSSGDSGGGYAVYVSTDDASATQSALQKYQSAESANTGGVSHSFTTQAYQGVTITAVTENPGGVVVSYAIVDNVLVLAGSTSYLEEIVDTEQGRDPSIDSNADYQQVIGQLPTDRLGLFFMDYPKLVSMLQSESSNPQGEGVSLQPELDLLQAYRGMGVGVEAQPDGLAIDSVTDYDASQLGADEQALLGTTPDHNAAAALTPAGVVAFYGFTGTQYLVRELVDALKNLSPDVGSFLGQSGVGTALADLTGDLGIELDDHAGTPAGALIVGTSDPAATRQFLDSTIPSVIGQTIVPGETGPAPSLTHVTDDGVDITVYSLPGAGLSLAWTVTGGEAILATSPAELEAIIATTQGAPSLAQSTGYAQTAGSQPSVAVGYIDMSQLTPLIEQILGTANQASFEANVLPNLRPISSISVTVTNGSGEIGDHTLIEVP
ncbi:MAG: DUF3352 domain-containing protein [Candidatus Dormiibacterota bacterium]